MSSDSFDRKLVHELVEISRHLDSEELPEVLMRAVERLMGAERAMVLQTEGKELSDGHRNLGVQYSSHPLDDLTHSKTVVEKAMEAPEGYHVLNETVGPSASMHAHKIRSCAAATVRRGSRIIGAVYCDIRKSKRELGTEDCKKLKIIADVLAPLISEIEARESRRKQQTLLSEQTERISQAVNFDDLIGASAFIKELRRSIKEVANLNQAILITGPTGSGKDLVARLIHAGSDRRGKFVTLNCAEVPNELLASELFGHTKGSFTGASVSRTGLIMEADDGTLFLDEIGNASLDFQAKLLRVIETKEVRPVGVNLPSGKVDVRFIFATNKILEEMISDNKFMPDLYYRINQIRLAVPSLSQRREDISPLAIHYAKPLGISKEARDHLSNLDWPGNVRELRTLVELARDLVHGDEITKDEILNASRYAFKFDKIEAAVHSVQIGILNFYLLKAAFEEGRYSVRELEEILRRLYFSEGEKWSKVGHRLSMTKPEDSKKFDNFLQNLKRRYSILNDLRRN